ncbi:MAG: hypothetical protein KatS3mg076_1687 [Candidatus Binatia bacterium]|nr:MAG: hypothetical protein KatS3mg076_1687 [Candidatus Binatia bacterium]
MTRERPEKDGAAELGARIREFARARAYPDSLLERWLGMQARDAGALWRVASALRLGPNHWRDVAEWAEEIALREGGTVADVLERAEVREAWEGRPARNEALRSLRAVLRKLRFPRLAACEERIRAALRDLGLPPHVRVRLPEYLRDAELTLEIRASDAAALSRAVRSLEAALADGRWSKVFESLRELPE